MLKFFFLKFDGTLMRISLLQSNFLTVSAGIKEKQSSKKNNLFANSTIVTGKKDQPNCSCTEGLIRILKGILSCCGIRDKEEEQYQKFQSTIDKELTLIDEKKLQIKKDSKRHALWAEQQRKSLEQQRKRMESSYSARSKAFQERDAVFKESMRVSDRIREQDKQIGRYVEKLQKTSSEAHENYEKGNINKTTYCGHLNRFINGVKALGNYSKKLNEYSKTDFPTHKHKIQEGQRLLDYGSDILKRLQSQENTFNNSN